MVGRPVVLWLQQAFRVHDNPALNEAVGRAHVDEGGLVVLHGLDPEHPLGSPRVNRYLMEAALETLGELEARGALVREIPASRDASLADAVVEYAVESKACAVVVDDPVAYMPAANIRRAARLIDGEATELVPVEANVVVPTRAYGKAAYGAYAIRSHIERESAERLAIKPPRLPARFAKPDVPEPPGLPLAKCHVSMYDSPTRHPHAGDIGTPAGERAAHARLDEFVAGPLATYNDRGEARFGGHHANLSADLHFGTISPQTVARAVLTARVPEERKRGFLEQLLVRRELAFNAARWLPTLRSLDVLPDWAKLTLARHDGDRREHVYSLADWEAADTHDEIWNATEQELIHRGTIHPYLRMYWGKKIIEWSATHEDARNTMEVLNGAWAFDGRSPLMWASHLWCFGLHDRAFVERPIFGKIRWMSGDSTRKKFDIKAYIAWTGAGCPQADAPS